MIMILTRLLIIALCYHIAAGFVFRDAPGQFSSPNYPRNYPSNSDITWFIIAPEGNTIGITFFDINIENDPTCKDDYLKLTEHSDSEVRPIALICGYASERSCQTTTNFLRVHFVSDGSVQRTGFTANFTFYEKEYTTVPPTSIVNTTLTSTSTAAPLSSTSLPLTTLTTSTRLTTTARPNVIDGRVLASHANDNNSVVIPLVIVIILLAIALILLSLYTCRDRIKSHIKPSKSRIIINPNYIDTNSQEENNTAPDQNLDTNNGSSASGTSPKNVREARGRQTENNEMVYSVIEDVLPQGEIDQTSRKSVCRSIPSNDGTQKDTDTDTKTGNLATGDVYNSLMRSSRKEKGGRGNSLRYSHLALDDGVYDHTPTSSRINDDIYSKVNHKRHRCTLAEHALCELGEEDVVSVVISEL